MLSILKKIRFFAPALVWGVLMGSAYATPLYLKGEVFYRERVALPMDSIVEVSLLDVSRSDIPPKTIGVTKFKPQTEVPIQFEIRFDSSNIKPKAAYILQAKIESGGRLLYMSAEHFPVFQEDENEPRLMLERVKDSSDSDSRAALSGDWTIDRLKGKKVIGSTPFGINIADDHIAGIAGCNRFNGGFKISGQKIEFLPIISTQMACEEKLMKQEQAFFDLLDKVSGFKADENELSFLDSTGSVLIHFIRKKPE